MVLELNFRIKGQIFSFAIPTLTQFWLWPKTESYAKNLHIYKVKGSRSRGQ